MTRKKPALTPLDKRIAILVALYRYDEPRNGLNAYTIENLLTNKVDLKNELNELTERGLIVEISGEHVRKNATFYNITPKGKRLVDLLRKLNLDPDAKDLIEWGFRLKGIADNTFSFDRSDDSRPNSPL